MAVGADVDMHSIYPAAGISCQILLTVNDDSAAQLNYVRVNGNNAGSRLDAGSGQAVRPMTAALRAGAVGPR